MTKFTYIKEQTSHIGLRKEDHYSVSCQSGNEYLFHFTLAAEHGIKPAEVIANHLYEWLSSHGAESSLQAVGCDSTNVNTGHLGGVIQYLEKKTKQKIKLVGMSTTHQ